MCLWAFTVKCGAALNETKLCRVVQTEYVILCTMLLCVFFCDPFSLWTLRSPYLEVQPSLTSFIFVLLQQRDILNSAEEDIINASITVTSLLSMQVSVSREKANISTANISETLQDNVDGKWKNENFPLNYSCALSYCCISLMWWWFYWFTLSCRD